MQTFEHRICHVDDIEEGKSRGFEVNDQSLFLVKYNGALYCYSNTCPHLGVELEWMEDQFLDPDGKLIQCHLHGALFTIEDGSCIAGPCTGDSLESLPIDIREGSVFLSSPARKTEMTD